MRSIVATIKAKHLLASIRSLFLETVLVLPHPSLLVSLNINTDNYKVGKHCIDCMNMKGVSLLDSDLGNRFCSEEMDS